MKSYEPYTFKQYFAIPITTSKKNKYFKFISSSIVLYGTEYTV